MVIALVAIIASVLSHRPAYPLLLLACSLTTLAALRIPAKFVLSRLAAPTVIVAVIIVFKAILSKDQIQMVQLPTAPTAAAFTSFTLLGWHIKLFSSGLWQGAIIGARMLGAVSLMVLLSCVTPAHDLFRAIAWFRIPREFTEVAMFVYRYSFSLVDQAADVALAQRVRLGYAGPLRQRLSSMGILAGAMVVRSIDQSQRTYEAMKARGYTGRMHFSQMTILTPGEWMIMATGTGAVLGIFWVAEYLAW